MGAGGATWETAGTLDLGSDNTFDVSDSTQSDVILDEAWWTYTPADDSGILRFATSTTAWFVFRGDDYETREFVGDYDFEGDTGLYLLEQGVTYHFAVGHFSGPPPDTYTVTASFEPWLTSPWIDALQDDPDNYLIVTDGAARAENPNEHYRFDGDTPDDWLSQVMQSGPGRTGDYRAVEVLGGDPIGGAINCCISHARNGEVGNQMWNGSGDDADDASPAICKPLADAGVILDSGPESIQTGYVSGWSDDDVWMTGGGAGAVVSGPSYFLWYLPVRDNLPPRGALPLVPSPEDYGYPSYSEGTTIVWEAPHAELVGLEIADGDPVEAADYPNVWALNDGAGPIYGSEFGWFTGIVPLGGEYQHVSWVYDFGDTAWQEVPDTAGWDGHGWREDYGDVPAGVDGTAIAQPDTNAENVAWDRFARPALKFKLQAARFRFIYNGPVASPVTRQYPRDDGRGISSAPRLYPPTKAGRLAGGYS